MSRLQEFAGTHDLAINLTLRELRGRYKQSVLGWTWSLLNPLATVAIYSLVFRYFLKIDPPTGHPSGLHSFALFLLCALVPWNLFQNGLNMGLGSLVGNGNLIKKVYFPRELLVVSGTASLVVTMLIEMGVLCAILLIVGNMVLPWIPVVILLIAIEAVFVFGCALVLSVCNVYFRDVQYLIAIAAAGALLHRADRLPDPVRARCTRPCSASRSHCCGSTRSTRSCVSSGAFRDVLYDLRFPPLWDLAYISMWAVGMLLVGLLGVRQARPPTRRGGLTVGAAIVVDDVWKKFRLYDERNQSLKAAVMRGRRARYKEFEALKDVSFEIRSRAPRSASSARTARARAPC